MSSTTREWSVAELRSVHDMPLLDLVYRAATVHRQHFDPRQVQKSRLLSVKTGGCPEDCAYCPQAARYDTGVDPEPLMALDDVLAAARRAQDEGASRFCLGAAWREVADGSDFERILEMVEAVADMGLEVCCTLGMLSEPQARRLKTAGLYAYNHNLDTSSAFYTDIISTRSYDERLQTLRNVRRAGVTICAGGIVGMGESVEDRLALLHTLTRLQPHPESVPINQLIAIPGTPLEDRPPLPPWEFIRMIATARCALPTSMVRLSAGRESLSTLEQGLCFLAGANSIFVGDKLLTASNPEVAEDEELFAVLGLYGSTAPLGVSP